MRFKLKRQSSDFDPDRGRTNEFFAIDARAREENFRQSDRHPRLRYEKAKSLLEEIKVTRSADNPRTSSVCVRPVSLLCAT
jgi:hypothetical protein